MTSDELHLADLTAAVEGLRADNARLAQEVRLIRSRSGWILLLASLLFLFGSCASHGNDDAATRQQLDSLKQQITGSTADDMTPGRDLRSQQIQQCRMLGRLGRQLKVDVAAELASDGGVDSGCVTAARQGFTGQTEQP